MFSEIYNNPFKKYAHYHSQEDIANSIFYQNILPGNVEYSTET